MGEVKQINIKIKLLKFHNMTITIRSVFEDGKVYLDDTLYELNV